jgi:hypothetical protein
LAEEESVRKGLAIGVTVMISDGVLVDAEDEFAWLSLVLLLLLLLLLVLSTVLMGAPKGDAWRPLLRKSLRLGVSDMVCTKRRRKDETGEEAREG